MTTIRVDPQSRPLRRTRRSFGILRDVRTAWRLTLQAWRRMPLAFAAALVMWSAVRFGCLDGLAQAHLEPGGRLTLPAAASLLLLAITVDVGPIVLAALLWPGLHRMILDAPAPGRSAWLGRAARLFGTALLLALAAAAALGLPLALALWLRPALGRVSTILTLILLLPAVGLALLAVLRLSFGLPAISLGLPRALAEGWDISRLHGLRAALVWLLAILPVAMALVCWMVLAPDRFGWAVRPALDVLLVSLTGSLTGLFYRDMRLPIGLRPDVRPSWNAGMRREPNIM